MNRLHSALPASVKTCVWNIKYGFLGYPHFVAPSDVLRYLAKRLTESESVLDLGCGRGSLLRALRATGWAGSYCGVDISRQAIKAARQCNDQRSSWAVSTFESFSSPFRWDVVALVETLCYVKQDDLPSFLRRITGMLAPRGTLLVRLHELSKHQGYIDEMYRLYPSTAKVEDGLFCLTKK